MTENEVRLPLTIRVENAVIVDVKVLKSTRQNISKFFINQYCSAEQDLRTGSFDHIALNWCVFDKGFGVRLLLIYDSDHAQRITVDGYISGITGIYETNISEFSGGDEEGVINQTIDMVLSTILVSMLGIASLRFAKKFNEFLKGKFENRVLVLVRSVAAFFVVMGFTYIFFFKMTLYMKATFESPRAVPIEILN